ncbi:MAG TPA: serine hydrolase, partial [Mucilaginibacter sp.]|nr:serine hydrolase [Mucilaginibacter sp.]
MARFTKSFVLAAFACLLNYGIFAQNSAFPHSTPEAQGVSSVGIDSFLTAVGQSKNEFHSIMILRHGRVIAEGWWNPYRADLKHTLYSCSKSFTSTAIGFAVSEGRLKVTDKVISFFPNSLPDTVSAWLAQLTVKDLLTMSVGMEPDPTGVIPFKTTDWIKAFLATPIKHQPGTVFLYNSMATFVLSAIVQKVTGEKVMDYLKPRLFDPLGIHGEDWEANLQGINTGGWGLRLKTGDLAKMGQFYLQKGMWNGRQLLPLAWVNEATTFKIDQAPAAPKSKKDSSDWMQGYCYQFWRCRHNAFRADGAFGQYIIVMPEQDAVIAITSETADMQSELNLVWKYLLPAMRPTALSVNSEADTKLDMDLDALALPPLPAYTTEISPDIVGRLFSLKANPLQIGSIEIRLKHDTCELLMGINSGVNKLDFGSGKWLPGLTNLPGPSLLLGAKEDISFLAPYKVDGSYTWRDGNIL